MSGTRGAKTRRAIPEYVKRAVIARDGNRCRNCGVETEFLHWDHLFPFDLGGPNTVENVEVRIKRVMLVRS
jgi:5-methylcytosine-specific restriction endonuclease McrA